MLSKRIEALEQAKRISPCAALNFSKWMHWYDNVRPIEQKIIKLVRQGCTPDDICTQVDWDREKTLNHIRVATGEGMSPRDKTIYRQIFLDE